MLLLTTNCATLNPTNLLIKYTDDKPVHTIIDDVLTLFLNLKE